MFAALVRAVIPAEPVDSLQPLADDVRPRIGDSALRNQAAAERNLTDHLPRQRAPPERAAHDRRDLPLLLEVSHLAIAGGADQERHAYLVNREERGVAGEFAHRPRQLQE